MEYQALICQDYSNKPTILLIADHTGFMPWSAIFIKEQSCMDMYSGHLGKLIEQFSKLPGIGSKTAQRLSFHVLNMPLDEVKELSSAILLAKEKTKYCSVCCNITDKDVCDICSNEKRDKTTLCVVESPKDVAAIERMREYTGMYHVLHGVISPLQGIRPEDIRLRELMKRLGTEDVKEVIVATNPDIEGEATASYISKLIKPMGIAVTRIAHGIPVGGDLEYVDEVTLSKAIEGRTRM